MQTSDSSLPADSPAIVHAINFKRAEMKNGAVIKSDDDYRTKNIEIIDH